MLSTRNTGQNILQDLRYTYDPEGNITELTDDAQQTLFFANQEVNPRSTYQYDALYRLQKATGRELNGLGMPNENDYTGITAQPDDHSAVQLYTRTYTYDQLGNMLTEKNVSNTTVWTRTNNFNFSENNYLRSHNDATENAYLYDAHGNMTKMPHLQNMAYDYADQLHAVELDLAGNRAYYVYDAGGNRVRKVVEKGNIVEERFYIGNYEYFTKTNNGTVEEERETIHVKDDKQVIALIDKDILSSLTSVRYQLTNHLDSASLELDEFGHIISYEEYHPFGTTSYRSGRSEAEVSLKRYNYVFKELDNETGLYYYGMRYYAPWLARFISVDPLQFKYPYYTPFQYAGNKPISYIDLDGAEEWYFEMGPILERQSINLGVQKDDGSYPTMQNAVTYSNLPEKKLQLAGYTMTGISGLSIITMGGTSFAIGQSSLRFIAWRQALTRASVLTGYDVLNDYTIQTVIYEKTNEEFRNNLDFTSPAGVFTSVLAGSTGLKTFAKIAIVGASIAFDAAADLSYEGSRTIFGIGGYTQKPNFEAGLDAMWASIEMFSVSNILKARVTELETFKRTPSIWAPMTSFQRNAILSDLKLATHPNADMVISTFSVPTSKLMEEITDTAIKNPDAFKHKNVEDER